MGWYCTPTNLYHFRAPANFLTKELSSSQYRFSYPVFTFNKQDRDLVLECTTDAIVDDLSILNTTVNSSLIITKEDLNGAYTYAGCSWFNLSYVTFSSLIADEPVFLLTEWSENRFFILKNQSSNDFEQSNSNDSVQNDLLILIKSPSSLPVLPIHIYTDNELI